MRCVRRPSEVAHWRRKAPSPDEGGVSLVLALVMLIVLSLIFLAVANSSIANITNVSNLRSQRSTEYAASGATAMAVQNVRYSGFSSSMLAPCLPGPTTVEINEVTIEVDCKLYASNPQQSDTRVIDFYACSPPTPPPTPLPKTACSSANALLTASVTFDDYSLTGDPCPGGPTPTCGSEQVNSWILEAGNNQVTP